MIFKVTGRISFDETPEAIERLIRAMDSWPGATCYYKGEPLKIWDALPISEAVNDVPGTIMDISNEGMKIACKDGYLLAKVIQTPGKKRILVKDFILGNSIEIGSVLV